MFLGNCRTSRVLCCVNTCCEILKAAHMLESLIWPVMQVRELRQSRLLAPVSSSE
jgi:hypothetical protein